MFTLQVLLSNYDVSIRNWVEMRTSNNLRTVQIVGEVACQSYSYRIVNDAGLISVLDWIDDENDADSCIPSWTEFSE